MSDVAMPSYNLTRMSQQYKKLTNDVLLEFYGATLVGGDFQDMVDATQRFLKVKSRQAVEQSLIHLLNKTITVPELDATIWRLVGNQHVLAQGKPVIPWLEQSSLEWMPLQILRHSRITDSRGRKTNQYLVKILAGSPCPRILPVVWSDKLISMLASRMGFSAPWRKRPLQDFSELTQLRLVALADPERSQMRNIGFSEYGCMSSLLKWNKTIIDMRYRSSGKNYWPCPHEMEDDYQCYKCRIGYKQCPAATHPDTYEIVQKEVTHATSPKGNSESGTTRPVLQS